jgi:hypothetical protein
MRRWILLVVWLAVSCNGGKDPVAINEVTGTPDGLGTLDTVTGDGVNDVGTDPDIRALDSSPDTEPDSGQADTLSDVETPPQGCCNDEGDCANGQICINSAGGDFGACIDPAPDWQCWSDGDCDDNAPCISELPDYQELSIGCGQVPDEPGYCKGMYSYCCWDNSDCPEPDGGPVHFCIGLGTDPYGGVCVPALSEGLCYTDSDCDGSLVCQGGYYCPCGMDCQPALGGPGVCVPPGFPCCHSDPYCPDDTTCKGESYGSAGVCKENPPEGGCWEHEDCPEGSFCENPSICPCGALCDMIDIPGVCKPLFDECCFTDEMCPDGICVGTYPGGGAGVCVSPPGDGGCFSVDDCESYEFCSGAQVCPCGANCPTLPGYCLPLDGCCWIEADCGDEEKCASAGNGQPGICLAQPPEGKCWDDDECPGGMCNGASFCPCNMDCDADMWEGPGDCVYPVNSCVEAAVDDTGLGAPCPGGNADCDGFTSSICSAGITSDLSLPPICTRYCNGLEPCGSKAFCIDWGWSSSCVPLDCSEEFLSSCTTSLHCKVATKYDVCCPCAGAYTTAQIAADPCIFEGSDWIPPDPECVMECDVLCEDCGVPATAECQENQCLPVWDQN